MENHKDTGHHLINERTIARYTQRYETFGYSAKALGWNKGKQFERFHQLTSLWNLQGSSVIDIGCGFGDFLAFLEKAGISDVQYCGIDVTPALIEEGRKRYEKSAGRFICADFLTYQQEQPADFCFASGIFNFKNEEVDPYQYLWQGMEKMYALCKRSFSLDLLSDKVEYRLEHTNHYNPGRVLEMAYGLSRNVVLRNDYFPFEFAVIVNKNDGFSKESTMFDTTNCIP